MDTKWMILDAKGRRYQPPTPKPFGAYFSCAEGREGSRFETPRRAVLWWALFESSVDAVEIVAPFERSTRERCQKAIDDTWERVRLMGETEGGNGTGGTVEFVVDDGGGVDEREWTADECDDALDGIALAASAISQMDDGEDEDAALAAAGGV